MSDGVIDGFDYLVFVFQHDDDFSSRVYSGLTVPPELNGVPVTADLGAVPPGDEAGPYDDAIYALVVRPHAHLVSSVGWTNDRFGTWPIYVPVSSCS